MYSGYLVVKTCIPDIKAPRADNGNGEYRGPVAEFVGAGSHLHGHIVQQCLGRYIKFLYEEY